MNTQRQVRLRSRDDKPAYVVGMDAHSKKLAISIWDWSDRWNPCMQREIKCFDLDALESTYSRHVDLDSLTVIEASTNSTSIKKRLNELGFRAGVVRSDTIADKECKRKVCDLMDARSLAKAYLKGDIGDFVWTPSDKYTEYRDIVFAYRDASKEATRISNRIWNTCSRKGYRLPIRGATSKAASVRAMIAELDLSGFAREQLEMLVEDYERMLARKEAMAKKMAEIVMATPGMIRLMQLTGVNYKGAFALESAVEDVRRFSKASKLSAYGGFSPIVDTSGDEEERARKRGGTGKSLDGEGRRDIKFFFIEAGQTVLMCCPKSKLGKWGWAMINRGKPRHKVACAIGRKLLTYAWHIMRGDPTPNRDNEAMFKRKMKTFYSVIGATRMHELGFGMRMEFVEQQAKAIYGNVPETAADGAI